MNDFLLNQRFFPTRFLKTIFLKANDFFEKKIVFLNKGFFLRTILFNDRSSKIDKKIYPGCTQISVESPFLP